MQRKTSLAIPNPPKAKKPFSTKTPKQQARLRAGSMAETISPQKLLLDEIKTQINDPYFYYFHIKIIDGHFILNIIVHIL